MSHFKFVKRAERFSATVLIATFAIFISLLVACDWQRPLCNEGDQSCLEQDAGVSTCKVVSPAMNTTFALHSNVEFEVEGAGPNGSLAKVDFYLKLASANDTDGWFAKIEEQSGDNRYKATKQDISPLGDFSFHAVFTDNDGAICVTESVPVKVIEPTTSAPDFTVTADSSTVNAGQCTSVRLDIRANTTGCVAIGGMAGDGWAGFSTQVDTTRNVCPTGTSVSYGWRCAGPGGSRDQSVTISVTGTSTAPTLTMSLVPLQGGGGYRLSWDSNNTDGCVASGAWTGNKSVDGSTIVNPTAVGTYTYSLTCTGPGGQVTDQEVLMVTTAPQPTLCHGGGNYYRLSDVANITVCKGWPRSGGSHTLTKGTLVSGIEGTCAITCENSLGETVMPIGHTGIWLPNGIEDVARWYTTGCSRLPDHGGANEDERYLHGGTWDGRCATTVQTLTGPPTP